MIVHDKSALAYDPVITEASLAHTRAERYRHGSMNGNTKPKLIHVRNKFLTKSIIIGRDELLKAPFYQECYH